MSITPIAAALPTPIADAAAGAAAPAAAGFAALVASLLGDAPAPGTPSSVPAAVGTVDGLPADETTDPEEQVATTDETTEDGSLAVADEGAVPAAVPTDVLHVLGLAWQAPAAPVAVVQPGADAPSVVGVSAVAASAVAAPVAGVAPDADAGPAVESTQGDEAATATAASAPSPQSAVAPTTGESAHPARDGDVAVATTDSDPESAIAPTTTPSAQPAEQAGAPAPSAPSASPAPAAAAVTTVAGPMPAAPAEPTAAVRPTSPVAQVVPEVTRLASQGNGVHRLTMKLQPEALGEVRVTLTVRDGAVQVRLSGGDEAARALAEGAPELRRVLELAGASEAKVVVRDLAGQPAASQATTSTGAQAGPQSSTSDLSYGAQAGTGGDAPSTGADEGQHDQHARTRGGAGATDGLTDGATVLRPDPVSAARQGIDLTM